MAPLHGLHTALSSRFREPECSHLEVLVTVGLDAENFCYEQIDLPDEAKQDALGVAFQQRLLLPVRSGPSPAWEDRILAFHPEERYFLPPVVRNYLEEARQTGRFDPESAVYLTLQPDAGDRAAVLARFFLALRQHAPTYTAEAGLLATILQQMDPSLDPHHVIDLLVITGIISPCTRTPLALGLFWYEINSCLYWSC